MIRARDRMTLIFLAQVIPDLDQAEPPPDYSPFFWGAVVLAIAIVIAAIIMRRR